MKGHTVNRTQIVADVQRVMNKQHDTTLHRCLYWASATVRIIREAGVEASFQAGTAFWPRFKKGGAEKFGYLFDADAEISKARLRENLMPEMHAWVWLPGTKEIVDLTTGLWPSQFKQSMADKYQGWPDVPPPYLWQKVETFAQVYPGTYYEVQPRAVYAAYVLLAHDEMVRVRPEQVEEWRNIAIGISPVPSPI